MAIEDPVARNSVHLYSRGAATMLSIGGAVVVVLASACGSTAPAARAASPTPHSLAPNYVALIHNYWIEEQAADEASNRSNIAAKVCLGMDPPGTPANMQLIDPPVCRERAVAILANQEKFLRDLDSTPAPPKFAADDRAFRTQLPKAIVD